MPQLLRRQHLHADPVADAQEVVVRGDQIASLDEESEIEQAWATEIGERIAAYRSGAAETFSAESVVKEARERLKR